MYEWRTVDFDQVRSDLRGRCFICELLGGNPEFGHHIVHEDAHAVAWLNKYPTLFGYCLVAPRLHRERVTGDFSQAEYTALQGVVYRVGEAIRETVPTERLYVLSLGSQQANRHVHWHIAPLPPGVPFEEQQLAALSRVGSLDIPEVDMAELAARLRAALEDQLRRVARSVS